MDCFNSYPFYGVQFHPEKNLYEWVRNRNVPHSLSATRAAQYFAEFFVEQCRYSLHHFPGGEAEEDALLIYNYPAKFTSQYKSVFTQTYYFDDHESKTQPSVVNIANKINNLILPC